MIAMVILIMLISTVTTVGMISGIAPIFGLFFPSNVASVEAEPVAIVQTYDVEL